MKYIVNSLEAYSDSATPKIGVHTSAYADDGFHLLSRMIVIPLAVFQKNIDFKNVTASLLAIVEKFAQSHPEMNLPNLEKLNKVRMDKEQARLLAQAFADKLTDAVVLAKPAEIVTDKLRVELLPIKVNPPVEPIEVIEPIVKEVITK